MSPVMTNFNRSSIYDFHNLCEIAGIDPDGHRRDSNRRRREESLHLKARPDAPPALAVMEPPADISSTKLLSAK